MDDQINKQQEEEIKPDRLPEVSASPTNVPPKETVERSNKLELLPDHIKKDLHELIAKGFGDANIKKALEDRYTGKTTFLPAAIGTFKSYRMAHHHEIMKMVELQKNLIESTKDSLNDVKDAVNTTTDNIISLENKRNVLETLFNKCAQRIKIIETLNGGNWPSAQFEQVIGAYVREQRAILETLVKLQAELSKDTEGQVYKEIENILYAWLVAVLNCYKQINGEQKFSEFKGLLTDELGKVLQSFGVNKTKNIL
jgi:hypothetical protein